METLQITKENVVKAYKEGNDKQKALLINLFGKKHFIGKPSTWAEVLDYHNTIQDAFDAQFGDLDEQGQANEQIKMIAQALNEGVVMAPFDTSQNKYYPYFKVENNAFVYLDCDYWRSRTGVGSRLCYKSSELAIYAGKTFIDIYKKLLS